MSDPASHSSLMAVANYILPGSRLNSCFTSCGGIHTSGKLVCYTRGGVGSCVVTFAHVRIRKRGIRNHSSIAEKALAGHSIRIKDPIANMDNSDCLRIDGIDAGNNIGVRVPHALSKCCSICISFIPPAIRKLMRGAEITFRLSCGKNGFGFSSDTGGLRNHSPRRLVVKGRDLRRANVVSIGTFRGIGLPITGFCSPV